MTTNPDELTRQIAALDDGRAITTLRLVLERQGQPVDPIDLRDTGSPGTGATPCNHPSAR